MTALLARLSKISPFDKLAGFKIDPAWLALLLIIALIALIVPSQLPDILTDTGRSLLSTAPYIIFAVMMIAYLKASGADYIIGEAFKGHEVRMIFLAALLGGLAPFCSCEVIPFIAGLLAMGVPLSAVMAFWLSSPLIDPPSLMITAGELSWHFAISKAALAVGIGLFGGFMMKVALGFGRFPEPLKEYKSSGCCAAPTLSRTPVWAIWKDKDRRSIFQSEVIENGFFLLKWLALAYLLESLMVRYVPASTIAQLIGGDGLWPIVVSAFVGAPAYLNSYAAPPIVAGLMQQGMSDGAAMAFMMSGAMSCIPAMTAVYALVRLPVFSAYIGLALSGSILAGIIYSLIL